MRLVIAAPANGALLKDALKAHLQNDPRVSGLVDLSSSGGTYPQLSFAAAQEVAAGRADRALLICGTGVGTAIAANKVRNANPVAIVIVDAVQLGGAFLGAVQLCFHRLKFGAYFT